MKSYKRFFSFGCSFTFYRWPTWADIIAHETTLPFYNYGLSGLGNVGILHRMIEADLQHQFTNDDLILVMWTHWSREDRYIKGKWVTNGNVFTNQFYDKKFVKRYWDWENDIIKNSSAIILANKSFPITGQYSIMKYGENEYSCETRTQSQLWDLYYPALPKIPVFEYQDTESKFLFLKDTHPDILQHLDFVNNYILPELNTSGVDKNYYTEVQNKAVNFFLENNNGRFTLN